MNDLTISNRLENEALTPRGLPLIPEVLRRRHHVFFPTDHRYKAAARMLQALWRQDRDLPPGSFVDFEGRRRRLGSSVTSAAGRKGANFLNETIARFAWRAMWYRERGAAYDVERMCNNLLSSQPLCFNAFAPLALDRDLATTVFSDLFPDVVGEVTDILFEHSPARGHAAFTHDYSAFDVVVRVKTVTGARCAICIEMKYSESCEEGRPRIDARHDEIALQSGLYLDHDDPSLRSSPMQQMFRLMNLAQSMIDRNVVDEAVLVLVAPHHNHLAQEATQRFRAKLAEPRQGNVCFDVVPLERIFLEIAAAGSTDHARALHRRYTDLVLIDGELELHADEIAASRRAHAGL